MLTQEQRKKIHEEYSSGFDNHGNPKKLYTDRIKVMTDSELYDETRTKIYLSARCANNHRSDYHWQTDLLYSESEIRRETNSDKNIYKSAFDDEYKANFG